MNKKDPVTVGNTTMFAVTIPVNIAFDEIFDAPEGTPNEIVAERFQVLEVDGAYLVIQETIFSDKPSKQEYKAFVMREDAFSYLELFGIEHDEKEEDSDRDFE